MTDKEEILAAIASLATTVRDNHADVIGKVDVIANGIGRIEAELGTVKADVSELKADVSELKTAVDRLDKKFDRLETRVEASKHARSPAS